MNMFTIGLTFQICNTNKIKIAARMNNSDAWEMDNMPRGRRYSVSSDREAPFHAAQPPFRFPGTSEDLHAWSIYRQVLHLKVHAKYDFFCFTEPEQRLHRFSIGQQR